ncbi:protein translocase subunit SecD [Methylophaga sp. OBS3]|uniref:protein translocase subunit SecD n=1 Tax=Methylophaga sp. OBS3 TaxID=2991934 RepID=UPI0022551B15|nr:protein translocase subunit SecD [Methylophaga sp. OBS3]MCX4188967.1 protein translocase subunit SecD [Methylophaga sp. OBS3]
MQTLLRRAVIYSLVIVIGLLSALPSLLSEQTRDFLPDWYSNNTLSLGLDLRGGSHLLLAIDTETLLQNEHEQLTNQMVDVLREARLFIEKPVSNSHGVKLTPKNPEQLSQLEKLVKPLLTEPNGGLDLYQLDETDNSVIIRATKAYRASLIKDATDQSLQVVRQRLDETGLTEPSISRQGEDSIIVQLPGVDDPEYLKNLLGTTAKMTFHWASDGTEDLADLLTFHDKDKQTYQLEQRVALEGKHIQDAQLIFSQETQQPVVSFTLDRDGARQFAEMTEKNIGRQLAILLDDEVVTAPVIRSVIAGGRGEISGQFTVSEANSLAVLLRAGALPAPLNVIEERTVGPDLGSDAIKMGVITGLIGAALVFAFMLVIYGGWGLIACTSLAINIGLIFGVLSLLGATLTLPGIAGIILSIGMAVDANILINERIREESDRGQSAFKSLDAGFRRAYSTILDANLTTLIAISLLFLFGSGPVRGFAIAMAIGLLTSMFTAIAVTRLIMEWRVSKFPKGKRLAISGIKAIDKLSSKTHNFMRGRYFGLIASAVLSLASIGLFIQPGLHYGIDFSGGSIIEVHAPDSTVGELRDALAAEQMSQVTLQEFGKDGNYLLRIPTEETSTMASDEQISHLKSAVQSVSTEATFPRVEMVGPKVSGDFKDATILAIILAGMGMLAYLWIRFEYHFAMAATITIALDLTKTIGFFALTGVEFNLTAVAALLALIGYSVNDKVVVFDRVRENLRATPDKPMLQVLNESISSTLTRTVFTSVTTFLALIPMAIAGGAAVASFVLPMLFGIVIGTSSSVFIAAPILYLLAQKRKQKGQRQLRLSPEEMQRKLDAIL